MYLFIIFVAQPNKAFFNNSNALNHNDEKWIYISEINLRRTYGSLIGPMESTAPPRSVHKTGASSGPHLDLIRPPPSRGGGVKQPHTEHEGPVQRKLRKQRCDTWLSQHHLRFHFIFSFRSSRWAQTHVKVIDKKRDLECKLQQSWWNRTDFYSAPIFVFHEFRFWKNWFRSSPIMWHQNVSTLTNSTSFLN